MKPVASSPGLLSLRKDLYSACEKPPTPPMMPRNASCGRSTTRDFNQQRHRAFKMQAY